MSLLTERLPEVVVEVGEFSQVGLGRVQVPEVEPLFGEVGRETCCSRVREQTADLIGKYGLVTKLSSLREVEQLVIRDAAPEKK